MGQAAQAFQPVRRAGRPPYRLVGRLHLRWTRDLPRPVAGERERLQFVRRRGWSALPGNNYRLREKDGGLLAEGSGLGHGLGLCARGATAMAAEGRSFRDILDHYYPNSLLTTAH